MVRPGIKGALFLAAAMLSFSAMSTLLKIAGKGVPTVEAVFFRGLVGLPVLLLLARREGVSLLGVNRKLLVARAVIGTTAVVLLFYAAPRIPVGEAMLLNQSTPIFALPLAALFLRERITWKHAALVAIALVGVALVVRPGAGFLNVPGLAAFASAGFSAAAYVCVRRLTATDATTTIVVWFTAIGTIATAPFALAVFVVPSPAELAALAGMGAAAVLGQLLLTTAYRRGEVGRLVVLGSLAAVFGTGFDLAIWGHVPDAITAAGGVVVIAACAAMQLMGAPPAARAPGL
jgi:drug/metabolite transporter (DMT)-like permease